MGDRYRPLRHQGGLARGLPILELDVRRREFITLLGGAAAPSVLWPFTARAQQGKVWRIGFLETIAAAQNATNMDAFRQGMREHRYIEGKNFVIEYRSADGRSERNPVLAAELVRLNVDLIVTRATPAVMAVKNATATIPIVMAASGDPLGTGVVVSLARPGGNVTGLSGFTAKLLAKRVEICARRFRAPNGSGSCTIWPIRSRRGNGRS